MNRSLQQIQKTYTDLHTAATVLQFSVAESQAIISASTEELTAVTLAVTTAESCASTIQDTLAEHIGGLVTLALDIVFPGEYRFELRYKQTKSGRKAQFILTDITAGCELDPLIDSGGVVDIATFALRIAAWALEIPKRRETIILDEIFKWVSGEFDWGSAENLQPLVCDMVKQLQTDIGLQFIMVTHVGGLQDAADKLIRVDRDENNNSRVTEV